MSDRYDDEEPTEMVSPDALAEMLAMARAARDAARRALTPAPVERTPVDRPSPPVQAAPAIAGADAAPAVSMGALMVTATLAAGLVGIALLAVNIL